MTVSAKAAPAADTRKWLSLIFVCLALMFAALCFTACGSKTDGNTEALNTASLSAAPEETAEPTALPEPTTEPEPTEVPEPTSTPAPEGWIVDPKGNIPNEV